MALASANALRGQLLAATNVIISDQTARRRLHEVNMRSGTHCTTPALQAMGPGDILQDDNARPHRAPVVNDFLQQQQVAGIDWPARSPDLNPIEHLWDALGQLIRGNHPPAANLGSLFQLLQQEWHAIPQHTPGVGQLHATTLFGLHQCQWQPHAIRTHFFANVLSSEFQNWGAVHSNDFFR